LCRPQTPLEHSRREFYKLTLPTVVAGREAGFSSEALRKMARVRVAYFKSDIDNAFFCFSEQPLRRIDAQIDVIMQRRDADGRFEQTMKVKLAQTG
jgi:hypothetical protein